MVSLRLHGKLQGEVRVKDLYPLLESVLKFKGFAMTCHKGNLVTIVPVCSRIARRSGRSISRPAPFSGSDADALGQVHNEDLAVADDLTRRTLRIHLLGYDSPPQTTPAKDRPYILPGLIEDAPMYRVVVGSPSPSNGPQPSTNPQT